MPPSVRAGHRERSHGVVSAGLPRAHARAEMSAFVKAEIQPLVCGSGGPTFRMPIAHLACGCCRYRRFVPPVRLTSRALRCTFEATLEVYLCPN